MRIYFLITLVNLIVVFLSRGPIEGDARQFDEHVKGSDWYGPLPPLLYGRWPINGENWDLTLSLVQVLSFCIGFFLLINLSALHFRLLEATLQLCIYWVGMVFCSQLWRDSSLLAFMILGFGLIRFNLRFHKRFRHFYFAIGLALILFASTFKFIFAPIISLLLLLYLRKEVRFDRKMILVLITLVLSTSFVPYLVNKSLSNWMSLEKSFPEQQPIIFDITSIYCWGSSPESNALAIKALSVLKKPNYPDPVICSSLEPTGWDTLRTDRPLWEYSSPLRPLTNEKDVRILIQDWLDLIVNYPQEYIEIKFIQSTQVLSMANALGPRTTRNLEFLSENSNVNYLIEFLTKLPRMLDKLRVFSLAFLFVIVLLTLLSFSHTHKVSFLKALKQEMELFLLLSCIMFQVGLTTISFVSNNGRYSLPFVVMEYIYFLNILEKKKSLVNH